MRNPIKSPPSISVCLLACTILVAGIGYLDSVTAAEVTLDILYLIPITIAAWYAGKWSGIGIAIGAAAAWCLAQHVSGYRQAFPVIFWWNTFMILGFFLLTSVLVSKLNRFRETLVLQKEALELALVDLRGANGKLRRMDLQKDEFLAVCSHDIRSPLCANIAGAQILLKEMHGPLTSRQREIVARSLRSSRLVVKLTGELLDLARIDAGKEPLNLERFNLADVVAESVDSYGGWDTGHPVHFEILPDNDKFEITADRVKIQRICNNLISNAVKYSPANGLVKIVIHRLGGQIEFAVSDSGPGIPPEDLTKLFDRFSGLARTKKTREEGTGLGLSITQELVKLHGGEINVGSKVGTGSTFYVTLPLAAQPRETTLGEKREKEFGSMPATFRPAFAQV